MTRAAAAPTVGAPTGPRVRARARAWMLFGLSFTVAAAWTLASPRLTGPDEIDHSVRAVGTARGHLLGDFRPGPLGYRLAVDVPAPACTGVLDEPEVCVPAGAPGHVAALTNEWRHPPPYYFVVGAPSVVSTGADVGYAMRLVSALAGSALLAAAFASALDSGRRLLALAAFVVATPATWFLIGVVNPNGVEIAAAICLWTSLAALTVRDDLSSRLVRRAGIALVVLVMSRGISPVYGLVVLAAVAPMLGPVRRRALATRRDVRLWLLAAGAGTVVTGVWVAIAGFSHNVHRDGHPWSAALRESAQFLQQSVGDRLDLHVSLPWVVAAYAVVAVPLVYLGIATANRHARRVLVAVLAIAFVLPITSNTLNIPPIASAWQGRYGMPLTAGVVILAALVANARVRAAAVRAGGLVVLVAHVGSFVVFVRQWDHGAAAVAALVVAHMGALTGLAFVLDRWTLVPSREEVGAGALPRS